MAELTQRQRGLMEYPLFPKPITRAVRAPSPKRYLPDSDDEEWQPPEEAGLPEDWDEQVADLSFFPQDEEVPGFAEADDFDWVGLDGVVLNPDADLPAVNASEFAEIVGIMEDAREDQVVGSVAVDDDFWIDDEASVDSDEGAFDDWGSVAEEPREPRRMVHIPGPKRAAFSQASGPMRGNNPNRLGWRFPRKPYGSHRRLLPLVNISREEERRLVSEVPRRVLVQSILNWAADNNVRFRPSITREHKGQILAEIRKYGIPVARMEGAGYYGDGKPSAHKDGENIDFERMKWGSFSKQAAREGYGDELGRFARNVLANPKNYYSTTRRRAHFYLNVLEPETRGSGKRCPRTGADRCECGTIKGGKLSAVGDPSLLESKRENPYVEEIITDPMDDKDIRHYYPKAPIMKYSDLVNYNSIEALLPADKSFVFLLYQHSFNNGHWVLLSRYSPSVFEFFCSYGSKIDEPLTWTRPEQREQLGEAVPYLTNLLKRWKGRIATNRVKFQEKGSGVATCGAYCVMRTACLRNDNMDLGEFQSYMEELKRETGLSYDEVVANFVSHR